MINYEKQKVSCSSGVTRINHNAYWVGFCSKFDCIIFSSDNQSFVQKRNEFMSKRKKKATWQCQIALKGCYFNMIVVMNCLSSLLYSHSKSPLYFFNRDMRAVEFDYDMRKL